MYQRTVYLLIGIILGSLLSTPVAAQTAIRLWATLSGDLAAGTGTPLLCTASGDGCVLQVRVQ
jgi:hypothetical protein